MAEANAQNESAVKEQKQQGDSSAPAPHNSDEETQQARLGILQAVERNDISVEQALNLLDELEA